MSMASENSRAQGISLAKSKLERDIQHEILIEFGALKFMRIWRMNTGKAYGFSLVRAALDHFKKRRFELGHNLLKNLPLTTYGTPGAADIQGVLTYDGLRFLNQGNPFSMGRFLAIECKKPGQKQDDEQIKWQAMVAAR